MIHTFNFHIKKGDFCIIKSPIKHEEFAYPKNNIVVIPENSVLRVDRISIKTHSSSHERYEVEFYFLSKKNKHIVTDYKIPNKLVISIYDLNGIQYSLVKEDEIDAHVNGLMRKYKIGNLLTE